MKIQTTTMIDCAEWDRVVSETYGRPYCLQQQEGCQPRGNRSITVPDEEAYDFENDTILEEVNGTEMGVSFAAWLARDPQAPVNGETQDYVLELFWHRNFYPNLETVANDLHARGILPAGEHVINIDW